MKLKKGQIWTFERAGFKYEITICRAGPKQCDYELTVIYTDNSTNKYPVIRTSREYMEDIIFNDGTKYVRNYKKEIANGFQNDLEELINE